MRPLRPYEALMSNNPLLRILLPFAAGIAVADCSYGVLSGRGAWLLAGVGLCVGVLCLFRRTRLFAWGFNALLALAGAALLVGERDDLVETWPEEVQDFRALLVEEPRLGPKTVQTVARIAGGPDAGRRIRLGLMLPRDDSLRQTVAGLRPGDVVLCHARITPPRNAGNPGEFDYAGWLRRQHISGTAFCFAGNWQLSSRPDRLPLAVRALRWRSVLVDSYEAHFQGRALAVFSAMTLGDDSRLDTSTREIYSRTGVSHVLALSGLHLSILFSFYQALVLSLCRRRWLYVGMSLAGVAGLWLFTFVAGMPLSLLRSAVMFSVMQVACCLRRDSFSLNNLALAALVLLFLSPQSLFDVGFQLSCLSVFFIVVFVPAVPVPSAVRRWRVLRWAYNMCVVSLCAQVGTAPVVAYYFHTFPVYGLLANLVAVPLSYALLLLGVIFLFLPAGQGLLAVPVNAALQLLDSSLSALARLPGAVVTFYPTLAFVLGFYLFLCLFVKWRLSRRPAFCYAAGLLLLSAGVFEAYAHRPDRLPRQLVCYNLYGASAVHAISAADRSYLWTSAARADSALAYVKRTFWREEGLSAPVALRRPLSRQDVDYADGLLSFAGCRVALLAQSLPPGSPSEPLPVDYMLLARGYKGDLGRALRHYRPRVVVLDGSLTDYYRDKFAAEARAAGLAVYDMRTRGALVVPL